MSELLQKIRARAKNSGTAPSPADIEEMANFTQRGGLARCLAALRAVAVEHLEKGAFPCDRLAEHLMERLESVDDGEEPRIYVATATELRKALASFKP